MVILVDDPGRENEGDLALLAEFATPEAIHFMAREGRGLICMPMEGELCDRLGLPMQVADNTSVHGTGFTVSIEAKHGVTTGISAADRAHTIQTVVREGAGPGDLARPGHVFPLEGDGRAGWNRSARAVTVHGPYVRRFIAQGASLARSR